MKALTVYSIIKFHKERESSTKERVLQREYTGVNTIHGLCRECRKLCT